jgi:hypothetical protein
MPRWQGGRDFDASDQGMALDVRAEAAGDIASTA